MPMGYPGGHRTGRRSAVLAAGHAIRRGRPLDRGAPARRAAGDRLGPPRRRAAGYSYAGPAGAAWGGAELDIEVVSAGRPAQLHAGRRLCRLAGPGPVPGHRDRAAAARAGLRPLPGDRRGHRRRAQSGRASDPRLLPAGRPATALRCAYYGANGKPFKLKAQQRLGPARARALAAAIARIPVSHVVGGEYQLPGRRWVGGPGGVRLPGPGSVDMWAEVTGCATISNGYIDVSGELP